MRLNSKDLLVVILIGATALLGCWNIAGGDAHAKGLAQAARLGREFKLKARHQVTLPREGLRIKFASVKEDSRCPADVKCVWAGNAAVRLEVSMRGRSSKVLWLNTNNSSSAATENQYRGYTVKLAELSPYPRSNRKIAPGDYVATLLVSKNP
ncbi:MAG TPA: hypothetical protein VGO73_14380 [Pyrinomonadaceae bacterium]|jgi:hypothetical protein|nr:hypothetical protein [Pyrinomonadaceae bacterium]